MELTAMETSIYEENRILRFWADDNRLGTQVGMHKERDIISSGQEGYLLYGPYISLSAGNYKAVIRGSMSSYGTAGAYMDAVVDGGKHVLSKSALGLPDESGKIGSTLFTVDTPCSDLELRVWVTKDCNISISHVDIVPYSTFVPQTHKIDSDNARYPVWVIVTGIVRDEQFLLSRFNFFADLKRSGYIQQVVFSTWKGEIEKSNNLVSLMKNFEFILVESDEPDVICNGHYIHQIVCIENALQVCPSDCFILKSRTDKCGPGSHFSEEFVSSLLQKKNYAKTCGGNLGIFDYKIGITAGYFTEKSNHSPVLFFWNDMTYFGFKQDLQKLLNYNVLDFGYNKLVPEQSLFASPFIKIWPFLSLFFKSVNQLETMKKFIFNHDKNIDAMTLYLLSNSLFRLAFLAERYVLHNCFFDFTTGLEIEHNVKYRGIEVTVDEDGGDFFDFLQGRFKTNADISVEAESLSVYLQEYFSIVPVTIKERLNVDFERYVFSTSSSNLSIIHSE